MPTKVYTVTCQWDPEAAVWYVAESDVPGLVTEAPTVEEMNAKLKRMIPELLELNESAAPSREVPFDLIARKREMTACA
jgi:predicted RNase H-like HicB family nuclease